MRCGVVWCGVVLLVWRGGAAVRESITQVWQERRNVFDEFVYKTIVITAIAKGSCSHEVRRDNHAAIINRGAPAEKAAALAKWMPRVTLWEEICVTR